MSGNHSAIAATFRRIAENPIPIQTSMLAVAAHKDL
jgi:hypothetical protein